MYPASPTRSTATRPPVFHPSNSRLTSASSDAFRLSAERIIVLSWKTSARRPRAQRLRCNKGNVTRCINGESVSKIGHEENKSKPRGLLPYGGQHEIMPGQD